MIFITVGTHEQQFNRLVEYVDNLILNKVIKEDVFMQIGYSTYEPKNCKWAKFLPYTEMSKYIQDSRITITHGGPASFIMPLQMGKIPIVVPRQKKYNEHVNDHQLEFAIIVENRQKNILLVEEIDELEDIITNYDKKIHKIDTGIKSNNEMFNIEFEKIVNQLF